MCALHQAKPQALVSFEASCWTMNTLHLRASDGHTNIQQVMCRYESLGAEGYHSLFSWYQSFEAQHFPDPMGMRETITRWTGHLYPSILKFTFALFDVPEAIAVSRTALCQGTVALTRIQARLRSTSCS